MQLEAIKIDNNFVLPQLDKLDLNVDKILVNIDDNIIYNSRKVQQNHTYKELKKLNNDLHGNQLVKQIMSHISFNYEYKVSELSDKEIAAKERAKKYE